MRYVAFLRGININGKNKIAMSDLKDRLAGLGYFDICSYLNSGNLVFSAENTDAATLADAIHTAILQYSSLDIPVLVMPQSELEDILRHAPDWWGSDDPAIYDNLIFLLPSASMENILIRIGEPSQELEKIQVCRTAVFWSFDRKKYSKANWWKRTAQPGIGEHLTIRTANTVKRLTSL